MNLDPALIKMHLDDELPELLKAAAKVGDATATHMRGGSASLHLKFKTDKAGEFVRCFLTRKSKLAQGAHKDLSDATEEVEVGKWRIGEDVGQTRLDGAGR